MKNKKNKKLPTKSKCKYYDVGNCHKYKCRCYDCKEYKRNKSYIDKLRSNVYYM